MTVGVGKMKTTQRVLQYPKATFSHSTHSVGRDVRTCTAMQQHDAFE